MARPVKSTVALPALETMMSAATNRARFMYGFSLANADCRRQITVQRDGMVRCNHESMTMAGLRERLKSIAGIGTNVVFVQANRDLEYRHVATVVDMACGAGVARVALMTSRVD